MKQYLKPLAGVALALVLILAAGWGISSRLSQAATTTTAATSTTTGHGHSGMMWHGGMGVNGTVSANDGSTITLSGKNGTSYTIDTSSSTSVAKIANGTSTTIQVSGISVGDTLMVMGTVNGTTVTATKIVDGTFPKPSPPAATGTVSVINGNTITLTASSTTYSVDASNATFMINKPAGTSVSNTGIQVGDSLTVFGTVSGTNITATRIMDGKNSFGKGPRMGQFMGPGR